MQRPFAICCNMQQRNGRAPASHAAAPCCTMSAPPLELRSRLTFGTVYVTWFMVAVHAMHVACRNGAEAAGGTVGGRRDRRVDKKTTRVASIGGGACGPCTEQHDQHRVPTDPPCTARPEADLTDGRGCHQMGGCKWMGGWAGGRVRACMGGRRGCVEHVWVVMMGGDGRGGARALPG
jgi:hypothetical protein